MSPSLEKLHTIPRRSQSFTLIELLVVIAILALLMSIVVITLNPAEMLRKTRDTRRISELQELSNALGVFQANKSSTSLGTASTVYVSIPDSDSGCANLSLPTLPAGYSYACSNSTNFKKTDGNGWIPVNFASLDTGSPMATLPNDPTNATTTGLYYMYSTNGTNFELDATFESQPYRLSGDSDKASTDGGDNYSLYEVGTDLTLNPLKDSGLVGYWKFDGGTSGSIINNQTFGLEDTSGNSNNGTAKNSNGTGMAWTNGKAGGAVSLDGADDYVDCGTNTILEMTDEYTIEFWMKAEAHLYNWMSIISRGGWGQKGWALFTGQIGEFILIPEFASATGWSGYFAPNIPYTLGEWTHIAITVKLNSFGKSYKNGILVGQLGPLAYYPGTTGSFNISSLPGFKGTIDDVRIYNRALSAAEISAIYNASR